MNKFLTALDIKDHNYGRTTTAKTSLRMWTVTTSQYVDSSRTYYSKSWHRSYGPKFTVTDRKITLSRKHGKGILTRTLNLNSWTGDYLARAVNELDLAPKKSKIPLSIRLNKAYDAKLHKVIRDHKIYSRTLLGEHVDYVIVAPLGTTYHDFNYKTLIKGLYKKIRAQRKKTNFGDGIIDWDVCRELGFCKEGIKEFCTIFVLNTKSKYAPAQIEAAIRKNPTHAAPFMAELKTLATAYNYPVSSWS